MKQTQLTKDLIAIREVILDPMHWTTGTAARNRKGGFAVDPLNADAKCFCLIGAIAKTHRIHGTLNSYVNIGALDTTKLIASFTNFITPKKYFLWEDVGTAIYTFNDGSTHLEVINMLDLAIQYSELAGV